MLRASRRPLNRLALAILVSLAVLAVAVAPVLADAPAPNKATAKFDLSGMCKHQRAGFVRFGGIYHLLGVHVDANGAKRLFLDANGSIIQGPVIETDTLWIRTSNDGDQARFAFSTDGEIFHRFGPDFTLQFGKWTGDRLGFFCWNDNVAAGHVDIDFFNYDYDGPKEQ